MLPWPCCFLTTATLGIESNLQPPSATFSNHCSLRGVPLAVRAPPSTSLRWSNLEPRGVPLVGASTSSKLTNGSQSGAELRDYLEKKMTPANINAAQKLARECVRKKYKDC